MHGPDGYLRGFQGDVRTWTNTAKAHPEAACPSTPATASTLTLTLTNAGGAAVAFTIGPNVATPAPAAPPCTVAAGGTATTTLAPSSAGRYDVTVTADTGDGFDRRFAGRVYP